MQTPESIFFVKMILRTRNITKIFQKIRPGGLKLYRWFCVNPEDVRLEHLHLALYRLLLQHQVRDHPGGVRRHWRRGS